MASDDRKVLTGHRRCRTFGHSWDYTTVERRGREFIQGLVCIHCATERYVGIDSRSGETKGNRYAYAEGYLFRGGGSLTAEERAELRLAEVSGHLPRRMRK